MGQEELPKYQRGSKQRAAWQSRNNRQPWRRKSLKMLLTRAASEGTRWPENLFYSCRSGRRPLKSENEPSPILQIGLSRASAT
jgi:hypothetical protein